MSAASARHVSASMVTDRRFRKRQMGGTITYGAAQQFTNLDPTKGSGSQIEETLWIALGDPLIWRRPGDTRAYPGLATSVQASPDARTFTFRLRKDVRFHDGTPFNAEAVRFNLDRDARSTISGGAQVALGPNYGHTDVIDPYTVRVVFKKPYAGFLTEMSVALMAMNSPTAVKKYGSEYQTHISSTGPFMLKEFVPSDHLTLVRNPYYRWAPPFLKHQGPAYLDSIVFRQLSSDIARVIALQSGQVQVMDAVPPRNFTQFRSDPAYKTRVVPGPGVPWVVALDVRKPPTNELAVRQAIEYAVNQDQIASLIFTGTAGAAHTLLTKGTLGYSPSLAMYRYNPARAGQLLDAAGWKMGSGGIRERNGRKLSILNVVIANFGDEEMATVLQQQLKAVGIDMVTQTLEPAAAFAAYSAEKSDMDYEFYNNPEPAACLGLFYRKGLGGNTTKYDNPRVNALFDQGDSTINTAKRAAIYQRIAQQVLRDGASVPLVERTVVLTASSKVALEDVYFTLQGDPDFYDVSLQ